MTIVKINALSDKVTVKAGETAECAFDVINATDGRLKIGIDITGDLKDKGWVEKGWIKVKPPVEEDLAENKSQKKLTVIIAAPQEAAGKSYSFKLRVYDTRDRERAEESAAIAVNVPAVAAPPEPKPETERKPKWGLIIAAIAGGVVLLGGIATVIIIMMSGGEIPDLSGKTLKEAEALLGDADLAIGQVTEQSSADLQPGQIIEQTPKAGEEVPEDKLVDLVVALLTNEVPSVVGLNVPSAEAKLIAAGFTRGEITIQATGQSPGGTVIGQSRKPPEREIPGAPIGLTVERQLVRVPLLAGFPIDRAVAALESAGLSRGETQTADTGAPQLTVVGQSPDAGQDVDPGTKISLLVEGRKVKVPPVVDMDLAQATLVLTRSGFKVANVGHINVEAGARIGTVRTQDPVAGKEVAPGRDVNLVVRQRPLVLTHAVLLQQQHVSVLKTQGLQPTVAIRSGPIPVSRHACKQGFVWRLAFDGDLVCVTPETHARVVNENSLADERRQPGGGDYGPNTCRQGFVWREARDGDVVCVTPDIRTQTAVDNAQASSRRLGST